MSFASPPPFVPKSRGKTRSRSANMFTVLVDRKQHNLVHVNELVDRLKAEKRGKDRKQTRVEQQLALLQSKSGQGRCACCYCTWWLPNCRTRCARSSPTDARPAWRMTVPSRAHTLFVMSVLLDCVNIVIRTYGPPILDHWGRG